jgi:hypothetical protein
MRGIRGLAVVVGLAVMGLVGVAARAQEPTGNVPAQYSATAFGQAGRAAGKSFGMNIYVDATSSRAEIDGLLAVLTDKGQDGLLSAVAKLKDKGRVAPTGSTGTGMKVIRIRPTTDGGQHIVLLTNRWLSFREQINGSRTTDYPFGIVVLNVDKDGNGTGTFAPLCKIRFNKKKELEIEEFGQKPFRLANVKREK